jgi:hypothetical protein
MPLTAKSLMRKPECHVRFRFSKRLVLRGFLFWAARAHNPGEGFVEKLEKSLEYGVYQGVQLRFRIVKPDSQISRIAVLRDPWGWIKKERAFIVAWKSRAAGHLERVVCLQT